MEKSAFKTTLAHGPGHAGVKENGLGEKSAKAKLLKSVTTQGVVSGRAMGGSAVAVLAEPITSPGAGIGWAETALAASTRQAAANILTKENKMDRIAGAEETSMTTSKDEGQILISSSKVGQTGYQPKLPDDMSDLRLMRVEMNGDNLSCRPNSPPRASNKSQGIQVFSEHGCPSTAAIMRHIGAGGSNRNQSMGSADRHR